MKTQLHSITALAPLPTPRTWHLAVLGLLAALAFGPPPAHAAVTEAWVHRYNSSAIGDNRAQAAAVDASGNVVVTGYATDGFGMYDYYTAKYAAADGVLLWEQRGPRGIAVAVAVDTSGNVVVSGSSATIKYLADGTGVWTNNSDAAALAVDASGNVVVSGSSYNGSDSHYGTAKYAAADGVLLWEQRFDVPPNSHAQAQAVAVDASGNVVVTGNAATIKYRADGNGVWTNNGTGRSLAVDRSGNVVLAGGRVATAKYAAANGALLWERNTANFGAAGVAVDESGNVVVTGFFDANASVIYGYDYYTAKYAATDGALVWEQRYNGPANGRDEARAVAVDGTGNVVVTGFSRNTDSAGDYYTAKYAAADGALLWEQRYNGPANGDDYASSLALGPNGMVAISGFSSGNSGYFDYATVVYREPSEFRITSQAVGGDGRFRLAFTPTNYSSYFILYRGTEVTHIHQPVHVTLGPLLFQLSDPTPLASHATAFYRVRAVPLTQPLDSDGDGIDDVYELRHPRFLNPLKPADAALDFDGDGQSNLQEYLAGSNPTRRPGPALAANSNSGLILKTNGSLWTFAGAQGQPQRFGGNSNYVGVFPGGFPVTAGDDWVAASASYWNSDLVRSHTVALKAEGSLWAWGYNNYGQLGNGTNDFANPNPNPARIGTNTDWSAVAAGAGFSTAIKADGTLWTWGANGGGQLGNGTTDDGTNIPVQVGADHDWVAVDNSKYDDFEAYTLALKVDGTLWSWGFGGSGQLGLGAMSCTNAPTRIGTNSDWRSFSAGASHVVALKTDGSLWTWGASFGGGLPTRIGTDTHWLAVAAGIDFTAALKTDGTLWSWSPGGSPLQVGTDTDWGSPP